MVIAHVITHPIMLVPIVVQNALSTMNISYTAYPNQIMGLIAEIHHDSIAKNNAASFITQPPC